MTVSSHLDVKSCFSLAVHHQETKIKILFCSPPETKQQNYWLQARINSAVYVRALKWALAQVRKYCRRSHKAIVFDLGENQTHILQIWSNVALLTELSNLVCSRAMVDQQFLEVMGNLIPAKVADFFSLPCD